MYKRNNGETLAELLIVIAIIGTLICLLLPAVQMARESARRIQCANHLKQLGHASLLHEQAQGYFPSGGWGHVWIGDPDRGFGHSQPGGWAYSVLPYLEQNDVYNLGKSENAAGKKVAAIRLAQTVIGTFFCPSRRAAHLYPHGPFSSTPFNPEGIGGLRIEKDELKEVARMCYAMNGGNIFLGNTTWPTSLDKNPNFIWDEAKWSKSNGIVYQRSETTFAMISDGLSNTYLIGEKNVNPNFYTSFSNPGDSQSMFNGLDSDNTRYAGEYLLTPDTPGIECHECFGGPHPDVWQVVFCDGSVHTIHNSVESTLHDSLASRNDGNTQNPTHDY